MEQLPALDVKQLEALPGLNSPLTVALGTAAPELMSRTDTVTTACQVLPDFFADPAKLLIATDCVITTPGAPPANEKTSLFADPVPRDDNLFSEALTVINCATAAGVAVELAFNAKAATPATCGLAMDVPLMVLVAVALVYQADVMLDPGANTSTHEP